QTMVEYSSEARFQLDLHVPDAVLQSFLPPGFTPNIATQGAAKDANLRAVFIDRVTINGPDGKPVGKGSNRLVHLVSPVQDPGRRQCPTLHWRTDGRFRGCAGTFW